ncbi:Zinc-type alcohol dehydrogenase-like protein [Penicillium chrysogenum]|uniref:Zinc-type alcohol dehydrogenase-like protein n=1 Tax=Penicillium chrysogenum TaxID=5076 RepID=A0A167PSQ3_PENCH|nr:Zinc-type alcohol dehydrogenase-like protein [Penicillium chrysogenum]
MMHGTYPVSVSERYIPASDCAAEVVGVESDVHNFQIGDLVAPISDLNNIDGTEEETSATGGVSIFSLLICLAAGIRPVITSSSDQKLQLAKTDGCPGAADTINYRDQPKWEEEARRLRTDEVSMVLSRTLGLPRFPKASPLSPEGARFPWSDLWLDLMSIASQIPSSP